ncbi:hypothetical protein M405DRAFT_846469 [Rhizopogon salebrosus TDB-379]|nr:hypothetical protein M405DRAFT_846469 [Rhizopogon salebrosus TDB-379]
MNSGAETPLLSISDGYSSFSDSPASTSRTSTTSSCTYKPSTSSGSSDGHQRAHTYSQLHRHECHRGSRILVQLADDALSARKMPKRPSAAWDVPTTAKGDDGRPILGAGGKPAKEKSG